MSNHNSLPDFICVGVQKSATTSLYDILKNDPQFFLPHKKETKFFQYDEEFAKGISFYKKYFEHAPAKTLKGEIDPSYIFFGSKVFERIKSSLGSDIKLIVMLRQPVERAYSQYVMNKQKGFESLSFIDAVEAEEQRMKSANRKDIINYSYISRGYYFKQLTECYKYFEKKNVLIVLFEDFVKHNSETLQAIYKFLGVGFYAPVSGTQSNKSKNLRNEGLAVAMRKDSALKRFLKFIVPFKSLRKKIRKSVSSLNESENQIQKPDHQTMQSMFNRFYLSDVEQLEKLIDKDLNHWKQ